MNNQAVLVLKGKPLDVWDLKRDVMHKNDEKLDDKPEIMRFKGLAEISPKEFQQFIGRKIRTNKVEFAPRAESGPTFDFYMAKNTPERKDLIMNSLVVPWRSELTHRREAD